MATSLDEAFGLTPRRERRGAPLSPTSKAHQHAKRVLELILDGNSWNEIADELGVDPRQLRREFKRHQSGLIDDLVRRSIMQNSSERPELPGP
jgi:methylphosphotriester-DNA--protein-cysteine methyltransferase